MNKDNLVVFKGRGNGINVVLDRTAEFGTIKKVLGEKIYDAKDFFGTTKTAITFSGRDLEENEESELLDIIKDTTDLSISFVSNEFEDIEVQVERKSRNAKIDTVPIIKELSADENMSYYYRGSLRSGQSIRYDGSVIIIGDVNPGAEVIAEGNIIVMGAIKGLVHAGCTGNDACFVTALSMLPTQMRISDIITYIPKELTKRNKNVPSYAYVENGQVYIVPLNK